MLIPALGIVSTISLFFLITKIVDYNSMRHSNDFTSTVKLSFRQIRDFYHVNCNRWDYRPVTASGYSVLKTKTKALLYDTSINNHWMNNCVIRIHMGPLTWIRFKIASLGRNNSEDIGIERLLESVQRDIDSIKRTSEQEIEEANRNMKELLEKATMGGSCNGGITLSV